MRDGVYANPAPQWRDWNERYYSAVELAALAGMRFTFVVGRPGAGRARSTSSWTSSAGACATPPRRSRRPTSSTSTSAGARWPPRARLLRAPAARKAKARRATRSLPVLGAVVRHPAGSEPGRQPARTGRRRATSTPTPAGSRPTPGTCKPELKRARITARAASPSGPPRPASTTPCTRARPDNQAPVSEQAAAIYLLRTFLEQFRAGIRRTFAYELIDEKPEPARARRRAALRPAAQRLQPPSRPSTRCGTC